jgi:hypothetical protein
MKHTKFVSKPAQASFLSWTAEVKSNGSWAWYRNTRFYSGEDPADPTNS